MLNKVNIIEDFYNDDDLGKVTLAYNLKSYTATYQPKDIFYPNRLKAMPCYETNMFASDDLILKMFVNTFQQKTNLNIENVFTFFRKTKSEEIQKSAFYKAGSPPHVDDTIFDVAGLVYLNTFSIKDGTSIFTYKNQYEPDIIVGSKPNRCIFYNADMYHTANYDLDNEDRFIQPFFIKLKGGK